MPTALITHPACLRHDGGPYHPECPDRLRAVLAALEAEEFADLLRKSAPHATVEQLTRVHPANYVEAIIGIRPEEGDLVQLDADTAMSAGSAEAALRAAGAAVAAVDAVMEGWASTAFAAVRPPGHHAEPARPMGFCLFNNAAVAALHARARWGAQRVAVVDFDVHHGNGTQAMFAADGDLFYASSHQHPCYPGTGEASERGSANNIVNAPLQAGRGRRGISRCLVGHDPAATRSFRPRSFDRLGRVRCSQVRPAGAIAPGNDGLCVDHAGVDAGRRDALQWKARLGA